MPGRFTSTGEASVSVSESVYTVVINQIQSSFGFRFQTRFCTNSLYNGNGFPILFLGFQVWILTQMNYGPFIIAIILTFWCIVCSGGGWGSWARIYLCSGGTRIIVCKVNFNCLKTVTPDRTLAMTGTINSPFQTKRLLYT